MHCWYTSLGPVYRVVGSGGQYREWSTVVQSIIYSLYSIECWVAGVSIYTWSSLQSVGQQWHRPVNQSELQLPHCHQSPTLQHICNYTAILSPTLQHTCVYKCIKQHCSIVTYTATTSLHHHLHWRLLSVNIKIYTVLRHCTGLSCFSCLLTLTA